jgi:hypothetical protein
LKKILFSLFIIFTFNVKGQFTLEHIYDSASVVNTCLGETEQLLIVNFEVSGHQYVKINRCGKVINVYNLSHALVKTISMSSFPSPGGPPMGDVLYLSQHLFNSDSLIEFMYISAYTYVYDENGALLFFDSCAPFVHLNFEQQQYPIYNTPNGTKMILSCNNNQAKVFGLAGTLSTAIQIANQNLLKASNLVSNPHPNPTNNTTTIDYKIPDGFNQGEIVFYDLQGAEIKRFKVDKTFNSLLISTTDIPAGTYYYQLQTTGNTSAGKKMVVVK